MLSPLLFIIFLEAVIAIALDNSRGGAEVNGVVIPDLRFADDIALTSENVSDLQLQVTVDSNSFKIAILYNSGTTTSL